MKWNFSAILFSLALSLLLGLVGSCGSGKNGVPVDKNKKGAGRRVVDPPAVAGDRSPALMQISYGNKSSKMNVTFDVNGQDVFVELIGSPEDKNKNEKFPFLNNLEQKPDSQFTTAAPAPEGENQALKISKDQDWSRDDLQKVITEVRKAQEFFYRKQYDDALEMAKRALEKKEFAEGYALMGSILFMQGNHSAAEGAWRQSLKLNPDMPAVTQMLDYLNKN